MTASRKSWLDPEGGIAIDDYARQLESYLEAVADGVVTDDEIRSQEKRVADLMREIEPELDDATREMTVYDIMQLLHQMQQARGKTTFRG
jgi:hypothetical protein